MDKKIGRRYGRRVRIATIVCARKHTVTPGTVCPGAIYVVYTIYNPTNNGVYIKYLTKSQIINQPHPRLYVFQNVTAHYVAPPLFVYKEYVLLPTILITYNISSKPSPSIPPLCGDTPFCAFGYEIIDFYLTRKKTGRRYGRCVRIYI